MRTSLHRLCLALPLAALACQGQDASPTDATSAAAELGGSFGAQTATDEAPAFDDAVIGAQELSSPDIAMTDATTMPAGAERMRVAIAWGYLDPHPDATEVVDWSGSIAVTNAGVRVVRKLRFEANDSIVRPRTDIHTIAFDSHTRPAADGLLLEVFTGPSLNPANGDIVLNFASAPITESITLRVGMRLSESFPVDAAGHVLAIHVVRPDEIGRAHV